MIDLQAGALAKSSYHELSFAEVLKKSLLKSTLKYINVDNAQLLYSEAYTYVVKHSLK